MKIGNNIRELRKAWGLTQKELGDAIHVADSTIAMYESGDRMPSAEVLQIIAAYLKISVDQLIKGDFTGSSFQLSPVSAQIIISCLEVIFPIIKSDAAMKDPYFVKGYERTISFWNSIKAMKGPALESSMSMALKEYKVSLSQYSTNESAANILWLLFIRFLLIYNEHIQRVGEAVLNGKGTEKNFAKKYILDNSQLVNEQTDERRRVYVERNHKTIMNMIKILKASSEYSDLGDYYIALTYVCGLSNNDCSNEMNQIIGHEMMATFHDLDNDYAVAYFNSVLSLIELHEE